MVADEAIALAAGLVAPFEGFSLDAYLCPAGVWTIGYGSTRIYGRPVRQGDRIANHAVGRTMLMEDLREAADAVERAVKVPLAATERAALISLAHNIGGGAFAKSTLLRLLNAGNKEGAAGQFAAWNRGGGRVLAGLVRRRAAEADMFRRG
ncbi:lysozyme [Roseomonas tokyonensis]|nr:lysozyme [Falsiroseomonas tokyonensis]